MEKYYVSADIRKKDIFCGRVKAIVLSDTTSDAICKGRQIILDNLDAGQTIASIGCMPVASAKALGDEETYAKMTTVGGEE